MANVLGLSKEQEKNLRLLAKGLKALEKGKLEVRSKFHMANYSDGAHEFGEDTTCGTVGCAVGHGPALGIPRERGEAWHDYCGRCFCSVSSPIWSWCFSGYWSSVDNTPGGAAKRILYALKKGVPHNYYVQNKCPDLYMFAKKGKKEKKTCK